MKLSSEILADRATLSVRYQRNEVTLRSADSNPPPTSARRPAPHSVRPPSLSQEVERILSSHRGQAPRLPRDSEAPSPQRSSQSSRASVERTSEVQPVAPRTSPDSERITLPAPAPELKLRKG